MADVVARQLPYDTNAPPAGQTDLTVPSNTDVELQFTISGCTKEKIVQITGDQNQSELGQVDLDTSGTGRFMLSAAPEGTYKVMGGSDDGSGSIAFDDSQSGSVAVHIEAAPSFTAVSGLSLTGPADPQKAGTQVQLSWSFQGDASTASINGNTVDLSSGTSGNAFVDIDGSATDKVTFTLSVTPKDGSADQQTTCDVPIAPSFTAVSGLSLTGPADPQKAGTQVQLSWSFQGDASAASINGNAVDLSSGTSGNASVDIDGSATDKVTFTLSVTPKDGSADQQATCDVSMVGPPSLDDFSAKPKEDDGLQHDPASLQVEAGKVVVLSWKVSNATDGVELTDPAQSGPQKFDANTTTAEVTPQQETQDYSLVAVAGDERSDPKQVHVSTHPAGHVYSPHAQVLGPGLAPVINYFRILAKGGEVDSASDSLTAAPGATLTLAWELEGDVAKVEIDNDVGDVTDKTASSGDASGDGTVDVTLPSGTDPVTYTVTLTPEDPQFQAVTQQVKALLQAAAPQPSLKTDAQNPQPAGTAFNLSFTIQNWSAEMSASIACDQDIGDGNGTNAQAVTVQSDGTGSLAINPQASGAFNAGSFNYTLTVTPTGGEAVTSQAAVTVQAPAVPAPHLNTDASGPIAPNTAVNLTWTIDNFVSGMTVGVACDMDPGDENFTATGQDVTNSLNSDGSGKLTVTPTAANNLSFKLIVTPQGASAVESDPAAVTVQAPAVPVPHLQSDASGPIAPSTAIALSWTIDNFSPGTMVAISCDPDPGDQSFNAGGQDVTSSLNADGSGKLTVTPTAANNLSFKLSVTPPGGSAAVSDPATVNVQDSSATGPFATFKAAPAVADGTDSPVSDDGRTVKVKLGNWVVFIWSAPSAAKVTLIYALPDGSDSKPVDQPVTRDDGHKLTFRPPKSGDVQLTFTAVDGSGNAIGDPVVVTVHAEGKLFTSLRWASPGLVRGTKDSMLADTTAPDGTTVGFAIEFRAPGTGWVRASKDDTFVGVSGGRVEQFWTNIGQQAAGAAGFADSIVRFRVYLPDPATA